jgi:inosine-uridine nucleoside N-ribohydrolase
MAYRRHFVAGVVCGLTVFLTALTFAAERSVPELPPPGEKLRLILDTDAACEIDDLYAIGLSLLCNDRFDIEGFIGAHFGDAGGPDGIDKSVAAIGTVVEKAGMTGKFPIKRGAHPFVYSRKPVESDGVDFIIERAMAPGEERPLWVVLTGPATDVASAWLKRPAIADRVVVFWHGRTRWPDKCWNFNAYNDLKAVRILFSSAMPMVLFDTGTYLRCPMQESERRMRPYGELGRYLHDFRKKKAWYQSPNKGFYDLGDIATLVHPSLVYSEVVDAPGVNWDMLYQPGRGNGKIRRVYQIDRDRTFELLFGKLAERFPKPTE